MRHPSFTDPITYWSHCDGSIESQAWCDSPHIATCGGDGLETVAAGVRIGPLVAAAPQLLDAVEDALAFVGGLPKRRTVAGRRAVADIKRTLKEARREARATD